MTIIVWDGRMLAADKQVTTSGLRRKVTKIFKIRDHLVGFSGDFDLAQSLKYWFQSGADIEKYPTFQSDSDKFVGMLVITPDREILKYERSPHPIYMTENKTYALGSGRDFAIGAMAMGANAVEAVSIASIFDSGCGMGIDCLTLEKEST